MNFPQILITCCQVTNSRDNTPSVHCCKTVRYIYTVESYNAKKPQFLLLTEMTEFLTLSP